MQIKFIWMLCLFEKQITYKTMFVSEVRLFPLICWFVNFTLKDKHGTKIYRDLPTLGYLVNVSMLKLNVGMSTFFFSLTRNTENTFTENMLVLIRFPVADSFYSCESKLQKTFRNLFDDLLSCPFYLIQFGVKIFMKCN